MSHPKCLLDTTVDQGLERVKLAIPSLYHKDQDSVAFFQLVRSLLLGSLSCECQIGSSRRVTGYVEKNQLRELGEKERRACLLGEKILAKTIPGYIRFHSDKVGRGREEKWAEGEEAKMAWGRDLRREKGFRGKRVFLILPFFR